MRHTAVKKKNGNVRVCKLFIIFCPGVWRSQHPTPADTLMKKLLKYLFEKLFFKGWLDLEHIFKVKTHVNTVKTSRAALTMSTSHVATPHNSIWHISASILTTCHGDLARKNETV